MQTDALSPSNGTSLLLKTPRFAPALEREFQAKYYASNRRILRAASLFMAGVVGFALFLCHYNPSLLDIPYNIPQIGFWLAIFGLSWTRFFARHWQPIAAILGGAMVIFVLGDLAYLLNTELTVGTPGGGSAPTVPQQKFYFVMRFAILMVSLTVLRLQFKWAALMFGAIVVGGVWAFRVHLPPAPSLAPDARFCLLPALVLTVAILLLSGIAEGLSRRAFWANHQLEIERNAERRAREQTEGKLQVLGQAIGSIVHDLGNPLTTVLTGAGMLDYFISSDKPDDKSQAKELAMMIESGAEMLNFLRLSLIEQTRVLEGEPIPVNLAPVSATEVVQKGARFQKASATAGRIVHIECPDAQICADEMKMVTVWMNLIGNALKYSDGEVRVEWRSAKNEDDEPVLAMAVLDSGTRGVGITANQASRLFKAFGRLETHANIEGTGLGLLSVQKIVEAHGGETYIEGFKDGTPAAGPFSTARGTYPTLLHGDFRTAFVATCLLIKA